MRNVNENVIKKLKHKKISFILTMRNVNTFEEGNYVITVVCFILTMRNVNRKCSGNSSRWIKVLY